MDETLKSNIPLRAHPDDTQGTSISNWRYLCICKHSLEEHQNRPPPQGYIPKSNTWAMGQRETGSVNSLMWSGWGKVAPRKPNSIVPSVAVVVACYCPVGYLVCWVMHTAHYEYYIQRPGKWRVFAC